LRLFSFGGYGLALAAFALLFFSAYDSYPSEYPHLSETFACSFDMAIDGSLSKPNLNWPIRSDSFYRPKTGVGQPKTGIFIAGTERECVITALFWQLRL